ncbi:hypothetical protein Rhe02_15380 [Rhizocola hellebori]|uniref:Uncharacterized protein n=1 Tax=Rhizocola hellebori TaxID=1392758 RepID=A0A8J3Q4Z6_9ACTN|nr:hypothetical protein [Rhizocola hellebori]GIH03471.1 hypothetical protein Rhe02_15380 [Rhizocola hellebori]
MEADIMRASIGVCRDASVAWQMAAFSVHPSLVTFAIGSFDECGMSGPFAVLMYSLRVDEYVHDNGRQVITASGRMRSLTMVGDGILREDVEHDFLAVAADRCGDVAPRMDIHFVTPFWTPGLVQPVATPSIVRPGWTRFGGELVIAALNETSMRLGVIDA